MDIRMPDGTLISNVPDGTSKTALKAKLQASGMWNPAWDSAMGEPETPAKTSKTPADVGPDNTPEQVAAADARMAEIVKNGGTKPSTPMGALAKFANGATFGFGDEIAGGMAAPLIAATTDLTLPESYDAATKNIRGNMGKIDKENPGAGLILELAGGLTSGGALKTGLEKAGAKVAPTASSALMNWIAANPMKAGAAIGAGSGGLYGFGDADGSLGDRASNAGFNAMVGGPLGFVAGGLTKFLDSRGAFTGAADDATMGLAPNAGAPMAAAAPAATEGRSALARMAQGNKGATMDEAASVLTPEQLERAAVLKEVGIEKPTAAMISRDPRLWQFERNTAKLPGVGDELMQRYTDSNLAIQNALTTLGKGTGGKASTAYEAGESVVDAVTAKNKEMQSEVGKLYGKVREEVGDKVGFAPNRIVTALDEASDNAYADNLVNSMMRKMRRYGVIDGEGKAVPEATLNINQAEELRKFANSLKGDHQTDRIVSNVIDALDDDVIETAGNDAFKVARDAARDRFREFESKILGGVADGKVVADDVLRKTVFGGKVKDVEALRNSLMSGSEDQVMRGTQAWSDLKLQALNTITANATDAGGALSGARLTKEMDKIGKERLEILFDPEELMKLKTIQKAAEYTTVQVPGAAVNHSNTASALSSILESSKIGDFLNTAGLALGKVPLAGPVLAVPGAVARASGGLLRDAAQQQSVNNALNPFGSALSRYTNPEAVFAGGAGSGILGSQFTQQR